MWINQLIFVKGVSTYACQVHLCLHKIPQMQASCRLGPMPSTQWVFVKYLLKEYLLFFYGLSIFRNTYLLHAKHCSRCYTNTHSFNSQNISMTKALILSYFSESEFTSLFLTGIQTQTV